MCASAIRWADFKKYVYGTMIDLLIAKDGCIIFSSTCFSQIWGKAR